MNITLGVLHRKSRDLALALTLNRPQRPVPTLPSMQSWPGKYLLGNYRGHCNGRRVVSRARFTEKWESGQSPISVAPNFTSPIYYTHVPIMFAPT